MRHIHLHRPYSSYKLPSLKKFAFDILEMGTCVYFFFHCVLSLLLSKTRNFVVVVVVSFLYMNFPWVLLLYSRCDGSRDMNLSIASDYQFYWRCHERKQTEKNNNIIYEIIQSIGIQIQYIVLCVRNFEEHFYDSNKPLYFQIVKWILSLTYFVTVHFVFLFVFHEFIAHSIIVAMSLWMLSFSEFKNWKKKLYVVSYYKWSNIFRCWIFFFSRWMNNTNARIISRRNDVDNLCSLIQIHQYR